MSGLWILYSKTFPGLAGISQTLTQRFFEDCKSCVLFLMSHLIFLIQNTVMFAAELPTETNGPADKESAGGAGGCRLIKQGTYPL